LAAQETPVALPILHFNDQQKPLISAWSSAVTKLEAFGKFVGGKLQCPQKVAAQVQQQATEAIQAQSNDEVPSTLKIIEAHVESPARPAHFTPFTTPKATHLPTAVVVDVESHDGHRPEVMCIIILALFLMVLSAGTFSVMLRRNPRRRAEFATQREECRRKRLYRNAAMRHRWTTWKEQTFALIKIDWRRTIFRSTAAIADEEISVEKIIYNNHGVDAESSNRLQDTITAFRETHRYVDGLVLAEEGGQRRASRKGQLRIFMTRRARGSSNADSEKSAPPPYDEKGFRVDDFGADLVDGSRDDSSVSSIITTSPRTSVFCLTDESDKE